MTLLVKKIVPVLLMMALCGAVASAKETRSIEVLKRDLMEVKLSILNNSPEQYLKEYAPDCMVGIKTKWELDAAAKAFAKGDQWKKFTYINEFHEYMVEMYRFYNRLHEQLMAIAVDVPSKEIPELVLEIINKMNTPPRVVKNRLETDYLEEAIEAREQATGFHSRMRQVVYEVEGLLYML